MLPTRPGGRPEVSHPAAQQIRVLDIEGRCRSMSLRVFLIAVFVLTCQVVVAAPPKKLFDATLEDVQGGGRVLNVIFYRKLPPPTVVDKILRESLDHAILIDPSVDILAMAFLGNDTCRFTGLQGRPEKGSDVRRISRRQDHDFDSGQLFR